MSDNDKPIPTQPEPRKDSGCSTCAKARELTKKFIINLYHKVIPK